MAKGYRYNYVKVIHDRQTGGTDNNTLITSFNLSPLQYYIKQTRQLERVNLHKNNITTIILFLGAFIWFVIFAADYTYHKDFMTWMHLLASITWWTCGMINFIIKRTSQNGL
jgi:hypothetical protein